MTVKFTSDATLAWKLLNGVIAIYKPAGVKLSTVRSTIINHLCRDLNLMEVRPPRQHVWIEGETNKEMTVRVGPSWADHPLLTGPRYQAQDARLAWAGYLSKDTSGVTVLGINGGAGDVHRIRESRPIKFYRVKGILGQATDNCHVSGRIVERATYKSIKRATIDSLCGYMQMSHQKKMFELSGVDIQSQAAYELAVRGPIRPANSNIPMIYAIKCVDCKLPEFTIEIVCTNEYEMYLKSLIHELGIQLHSAATCTQIQCTRYGPFTTEIALLKKNWDLQSIFDNMDTCKRLIEDNLHLLRQNEPILVERSQRAITS